MQAKQGTVAENRGVRGKAHFTAEHIDLMRSNLYKKLERYGLK
jgi:transcriptional regulator of acetoin/glycerol metabolism